MADIKTDGEWKRNDTGGPVEFWLSKLSDAPVEDGEEPQQVPVSLDGAQSVTALLKKKGMTEPLRATCTADPDQTGENEGHGSFLMTEELAAETGLYDLEFEVIDAAGHRTTYPRVGYLKFRINSDLG